MTAADYLLLAGIVVTLVIVVAMVLSTTSRPPPSSTPFRASQYPWALHAPQRTPPPPPDPMPPIPPEAWREAEQEANNITEWMKTGGSPTPTEKHLIAAVQWARYQRALRTCGL